MEEKKEVKFGYKFTSLVESLAYYATEIKFYSCQFSVLKETVVIHIAS